MKQGDLPSYWICDYLSFLSLNVRKERMDSKHDYGTCSVLSSIIQRDSHAHSRRASNDLPYRDFIREIRAPMSCGNLRGSEDFLVCAHSSAVLLRTPYPLPRPRHGFIDYCDN